MQINAVMLEINIVIVFNGLNYKFKTHGVTQILVTCVNLHTSFDSWQNCPIWTTLLISDSRLICKQSGSTELHSNISWVTAMITANTSSPVVKKR